MGERSPATFTRAASNATLGTRATSDPWPATGERWASPRPWRSVRSGASDLSPWQAHQATAAEPDRAHLTGFRPDGEPRGPGRPPGGPGRRAPPGT